MAYVRRLAATGGAVILIHHDTKAATGTPRGHSTLNGALNMALQLTKGEDGIIRGKLSKNRNGPCDLVIAFSTDSVLLAEATYGRKKPITAPMVRELAVVADTARALRLPRQPREALNTPRGMAAEVTPEADGRRLVAEDAWRAECDDRRVSPSADPKIAREAFAAAFAKLRIGRHVLAGGGNVWLPVLATGIDDLPEEKVSGTAEFCADFGRTPRGGGGECLKALRSSASPWMPKARDGRISRMNTPAWHAHAQHLAGVLDAIGAREAERRKAAPLRTEPPRLVRSSHLTIVPSRWDTARVKAQRDPAAYVDQVQVREIGWQLHALGGLYAMAACADMLKSGTALSYVDAAWDGIGPPGGALWFR